MPWRSLVLRETDPQTTIWELLLPEEARRLPAELTAVDAYLDDKRFIAPSRGLFSARLGRPSVPVDTLLRLLYLKHRYGLGYESLCREVSDSIGWRRFCRIGLDRPVPHPTTLVKLVRRAGPEVIQELNAALVAKLAAGKLLRARKLQVDTTVVEADIDYPTDADLLEHAVRKLGGLVHRIKGRGAASRTRFRDRVGRLGGGCSSWPGRWAGAPGWRWARWIGSPARSPASPGSRWGRSRRSCATPSGRWPAGLVTGGVHDWWVSWTRRSARPSGCWPRPTSGVRATG
jgi:IS5 family transposase